MVGKAARRTARRAEALQTLLGEHSDSVTAVAWLEQAAAACHFGRQLRGRRQDSSRAPPAGRVAARVGAHLERTTCARRDPLAGVKHRVEHGHGLRSISSHDLDGMRQYVRDGASTRLVRLVRLQPLRRTLRLLHRWRPPSRSVADIRGVPQPIAAAGLGRPRDPAPAVLLRRVADRGWQPRLHRQTSHRRSGRLARGYLIGWDQFEDVLAQENGRPSSSIEIDDHLLVPGFSRQIGSGRYENLLCTERLNDTPVVTFTAPWSLSEVTPAAPSAGYLAMLITGLREAHPHLSDETLRRYLGSAPDSKSAVAPRLPSDPEVGHRPPHEGFEPLIVRRRRNPPTSRWIESSLQRRQEPRTCRQRHCALRSDRGGRRAWNRPGVEARGVSCHSAPTHGHDGGTAMEIPPFL